ncbi:helix-turn-helix domain-containing protein [Conexibacter arvalis]|uniref:Excisionase family DNA binding protein n=1 Tax=Conexibacter arvalis TaxID=912552 RepID=A0A840IF00_9ACTN|nr:helix-turn-helix domain-containing protein [Conexibacter arvalis]MBB4662801.1 excisionase family DNA binding protein [Conexibacter arvalis]
MGEELTPLFVRLSAEQAERLDRAVAAIDARKKDLVAGLVDQYVDPDSPAGLDALRAVASVGRGELVAGAVAAPGAATARRRGARTADADAEGGTAGQTGAASASAGAAAEAGDDLDDPARPILTPTGAAALLGVRAVDVLELAEHGELPGRRVAGQWRFARAALIAWVAGES